MVEERIVFQDVYEMYYQLFVEIGLAINPSNQYLYDHDTGSELYFAGKHIKATVHPVNIYAGKNDIVFDPSRNYKLMVYLFGYFIDKRTMEDPDSIGYIAQYVEDENDLREKQRLVVKTKKFGYVASQYYRNPYLGYIECLFLLSGCPVDLYNFDNEIVL